MVFKTSSTYNLQSCHTHLHRATEGKEYGRSHVGDLYVPQMKVNHIMSLVSIARHMAMLNGKENWEL